MCVVCERGSVQAPGLVASMWGLLHFCVRMAAQSTYRRFISVSECVFITAVNKTLPLSLIESPV